MKGREVGIKIMAEIRVYTHRITVLPIYARQRIYFQSAIQNSDSITTFKYTLLLLIENKFQYFDNDLCHLDKIDRLMS